MKTVRRFLSGVVAGLLLAACPARAEVSSETDAAGTYLRTAVFTNASVRNLRIWAVTRAKTGFWPLNAAGDLTGDLLPYIAENPVNQRWPWVVWSHYNGADFDLVWSTWTGARWSAIAPVEYDGDTGDALDPRVAFDVTGRPHLVWDASNGGPRRVYLSIYLATRWMAPFLVSDLGEDGSAPSVTVQQDGTIQVTYDTPRGAVTKTIRFLHPATITDDITPFNSLTVTMSSIFPPR
jgi:hypothetical protein